MEWWKAKGLPRPVYIGLRRSSRIASLIGLIVFLVLIMLSQVVSVFSPSIAAVLSFLAIFGGIIAGVIGRFFGNLREQDTVFIMELVRTAKPKLILWSIPSNYVPAALKLTNGVYIYLAYVRGRPLVVIGRPITHGKVFMDIRKPRIHRVEPVMIHGKKVYDRIDAVLPYPDNPRIWYRMLLRGFILGLSRVHPKEVVKLALSL